MPAQEAKRDPDVLARVSLPLIVLLVGVALFQGIRAEDWTSVGLLGIGALHQMYLVRRKSP